MWVLYLTFGISLVGTGVPLALHAGARAMARSGKPGSEYVVLAFMPLFILLPLFMVAATISATALALSSRGSGAQWWWAAIAAVFASWMVASFALFFRAALRQRRKCGSR